MLSIGVPIGRFVKSTKRRGKWYCSGTHELTAGGRWVPMQHPCCGEEMSSKDIFDRHIKRRHLIVTREAGKTPSGRPIFDLSVWADSKLQHIFNYHY
jgi:hypothetical protein